MEHIGRPIDLNQSLAEIKALPFSYIKHIGCVIHVESTKPWPQSSEQWTLLRNMLDGCWWSGICPIFELSQPPENLTLEVADLIPFVQTAQSAPYRGRVYGHNAYFAQRKYILNVASELGHKWMSTYDVKDLWFRLWKDGDWWCACDKQRTPLLASSHYIWSKQLTSPRKLKLGHHAMFEVARMAQIWADTDPHVLLQDLLVGEYVNTVHEIFNAIPDQVRVIGMPEADQEICNQLAQEGESHGYNREVSLGSRTIHFNYGLGHLKDFVSKHVQSLKFGHLNRIGQMIVHELNNPIGGIYNLSQVMQMSLVNESQEVRDLLKGIEGQCKRAKEIIEHLSSYFGSTPTKNEARLEKLPIQRVFKEVSSLVKSALVGADLKVEVSPDTIEIVSNRVKLLHVLVNLVINAAEAITGRHGVITLRAYENAEGKVIEVQDNGTGIPPHLMDRILEPFFSTKGKEGPNSGLGLSLVSFFLDELGYDLKIMSNPRKKETLFRITIPADLKLPAPPASDSV